MKNDNSIEHKLDEILRKINKFNSDFFRLNEAETFETFLSNLNIREEQFIELLDILKEDKFIISYTTFPNENKLYAGKVDYIKPSLKGKLFINQNGYVGKLERMNHDSWIGKRNELVISVGTGLAGLYSLIQLAKMFYSWMCNC